MIRSEVLHMKSMTGYGKGEASNESRKVTIEIKSVNNRFLDINTRFPKSLSYVEDTVKKQIQEVVKRGTLDVYYTYEVTGDTDKVVEADIPLAGEYLAAMRTVKDELGLPDDITAMSVLRMPDVLTVTAAEDDREEIKALFEKAAKEAVASLDAMRVIEGRSAKTDLAKLVGNIITSLKSVITRAPLVVVDYRDKLSKRIAELLDQPAADETRIATEVAVFADKCDINEEISRLTSHIDQFTKALESGEPQGRRLDFLSQEMNREINTMGSKANDLELSKLVIEMKNELEKIKEQIRNVE
ncbi:MAG TPA: YicC family protein [Candidatus Protoclostridium stercorigallinarum]|uniref:YicC family protein n=1 Tax=Candidatus Protoclostridium stercorigallinarum TaxID=2838741 RepID=A0A9D1TRE4_9FIRM|nr:YicC family protein [Candidatus Protoclostridium stercorigallinarum]